MENNFELGQLVVPYDIAFKLKKLGFDRCCLTAYRSTDGEESLMGFTDWKNGSVHDDHEGFCAAPLWDQLWDWFQSKKIFISFQYAAPDTNKWAIRIDNYFPIYEFHKYNLDSSGTHPTGEFVGSYGEYLKERYEDRYLAYIRGAEEGIAFLTAQKDDDRPRGKVTVWEQTIKQRC